MLASLTLTSTPTPPVLPTGFSVSITSNYQISLRGQLSGAAGGQQSQTQSFYFQNSTDGTVRQRVNSSQGFDSTAWTLYTAANNSMRIYAKFDNDCRPLPLQFSFGQGLDISWLPLATFTGEVRVGLFKKANSFSYQDNRAPFKYTAVSSRPADGPSRLLYLTSEWTGTLPGTGNATKFKVQKHTFSDDLKVGPPAPTLFEIPTVGCFEKVPPCADGAVAEMEVYLAHPHQFRYLDNVSPSLCAHQSPVPSHALSILFAIRPAQRPVLPRLRVVSHPRPRLRPVPSSSRPSLNHHSHWVQSPHLSHPSQ